MKGEINNPCVVPFQETASWQSNRDRMSHWLPLLKIIGLIFPLFAPAIPETPVTNRFEQQVLPVLKSNCFECHSHAAGKMKGGLALDSRSGWAVGGDNGPAIVPGKPEESLLVEAIRHSNKNFQMPEEKMPDEQIEILVRWIADGAHDPRQEEFARPDTDWWSLKPLKKPSAPVGDHPVDAFIRAELSANRLQPAQTADRRTLIRRLTLDLHGMLPTPEAVEAFEKDRDPHAWKKLVKSLLDSPRYGERWARHWLDVIHFADSHGCEHDVKRPNAWRFRDYVIERLNADVSWERFIREQLAADVFYPNEPRLKAGLGFIAAGPLELSRAGTAPVTFDYLDRDDMVTQTMAAFDSTTANCARCHTHKFDPITQEDYYALQAVFAGIGKGDIAFDTSPETRRQRKEFESLQHAAARRDANILLQKKYAPAVRAWMTARGNKPVQWTSLQPDIFVASGGANLIRQDDGSIFSDGPVAEQEQYTVTAPVELNRLSAVRLDVYRDKRLPKGGPGRAENGNLHLSEVMLQWFPAKADKAVRLKISRATANYDQAGWTSAQAIDGDRQTGWAIFPETNRSHHIVFELAKPVDRTAGGKLVVTLMQLHPPKHLIGRFRLSVTDAEAGAAQVLPSEVSQSLAKSANQRTEAEQTTIAAIALRAHAEEQLAQLPDQETVYGASSSWSHAKKLAKPQVPKVVHLLRRGDIDQPMREVSPGALSAIPWLPGRFDLPDVHDESARRAALADWIAHPENPLTWRSIVNRTWHYHFGRGLCDTPNDFGRMGSEPSHPELLDWLAVWFRDEAKGSLKKLHTLILTSQTWRQSSRVAANAVDTENRLLWRMNRRRLDAESFRDSAWRIAGQLDLNMGGEGIEQFVKSKGPQSTPALDYTAYDWNRPGANRRSIYRVVWRGIPDPFMEALDFPDLALLTPKRDFSVSALQSLSLYNNNFVLHVSKQIANRIQNETAAARQVHRAVQLCWQRDPTGSEAAAFESHRRSHGLPALCRVLLNSNEFLFID